MLSVSTLTPAVLWTEGETQATLLCDCTGQFDRHSKWLSLCQVPANYSLRPLHQEWIHPQIQIHSLALSCSYFPKRTNIYNILLVDKSFWFVFFIRTFLCLSARLLIMARSYCRLEIVRGSWQPVFGTGLWLQLKGIGGFLNIYIGYRAAEVSYLAFVSVHSQ